MPTIKDSFHGARLKVKRADKHIIELNRAVHILIRDHVNKVLAQTNRRDKQIVELDRFSIPEDIPFIIGDAVHNLRSALDVAMFAKVGGTSDTTKVLPFSKHRKEIVKILDKAIEKRMINSRIYDLVLNHIKPYKAGNPLLYGLHRLDIKDKHVEIMDILTVLRFRPDAEADGGTSKLYVVKLGGEAKLADYTKPTADISFKNVEVFEGEPVIPTLHQLSELVLRIIDLVESY